ncbi:MAG: hypothetical protein QM739_04005 [Propionivibrio sp.]
MSDNIENLILEHLKKIQAEQADARQRDAEIMTRLSSIESGIARISRNESSNYEEIIQDRHAVEQAEGTHRANRATIGNQRISNRTSTERSPGNRAFVFL